MSEETIAYIALGGNIPDRQSYIGKALKMLGEAPGVSLIRNSDIIETKPLAQMDQSDFLNTVAEVKTGLTADQLHEKLLGIETSLGRVRKEKWSARTIDLDLLLFGERIINTPSLTVPHPRMHLRSFVLAGLCQLKPDLVHPVLKVSVKELTSRLGGQNFFIDPERPQLVSVAGIIGAGKTTLVKKIAGPLAAEMIFEPYDTNPFLPKVYAGDKELALDSQFYFLSARLKQLAPDTLPARRIAVSDYIFDKEMIYAKQLLDEIQLNLYNRLYGYLSSTVAAPVLAIYLKAPVDICAERIHSRNRSYEQKIDPAFLHALSDDYDRLFANWNNSPVITIRIPEFDCTRRGDIENLLTHLRSYVIDFDSQKT